MAEASDNLVLPFPRTIRATQEEHSVRFDEIEAIVKKVRLGVVSQGLRFDAVEERVETIREGAEQALGCAAPADRAQVDLAQADRQSERRVEKLEARQ